MSLILTLRIDMEPTEKDSRSFVDSNIEFRPAYNTDFLNEPDDEHVNNTSFVNNDGSMLFTLSEPIGNKKWPLFGLVERKSSGICLFYCFGALEC